MTTHEVECPKAWKFHSAEGIGADVRICGNVGALERMSARLRKRGSREARNCVSTRARKTGIVVARERGSSEIQLHRVCGAHGHGRV